MAITALKRDLSADHFLDEDTKPNNGRKLSDQRTDRLFEYVDASRTPPQRIAGYKPPKSGYFFAYSPRGYDNVFNFDEGNDSDGFRSSRSGNHILQFTVIMPGGAPENTITADVPYRSSNQIIGRAAEVAYFLVPDGTTPNGVRKYHLVRRQRLCALNGDDAPAYSSMFSPGPPAGIAAGAAPTDPPEVMAMRSTTQVFNLNDLTFAGNRVIRSVITQHRIGEDILLSNVTSFEVKFTGSSGTVAWPTPFLSGNSDYPYDNLPFDGAYDTFNQGPNWDLASNMAGSSVGPTTAPLKRIRITGVQIRLRTWDPQTKSTRQTTLVVDL